MKARANGIEIRYEVEGDGPWVMFSHSLACHLGTWDGQAVALRDRYRILRFDTRGHGGTSVPPAPYTFDQLADDVEGLLAELGVEQVHFVGISLGGMIAQEFALKHPRRLASLVLCDTTSRYPAGTEKIWQERIAAVRAQGMSPLVEPTLERWFTPAFRAARPDVMTVIGDMIRSTPAEGYVGCGAVVPRIDTTDRLRTIACPTLVVVGSRDLTVPPEEGRLAAQRIPGARLVELPTDHHTPDEAPEAFVDLLRGFLEPGPAAG